MKKENAANDCTSKWFAVEKFDVDGYGDLQVEILRAQYEDFNKIPSEVKLPIKTAPGHI